MTQTLLVNEIFKSLQGEGLLTGIPTSFLRLQGCNLGCVYCDTLYASRPEVSLQAQTWSVPDLVDQLSILPTREGNWICITGGEPLIQEPGVKDLVDILCSRGINVSIETNGSCPVPPWWKKIDSWVPDIKCPSSGEAGKSRPEWLALRSIDQVKFVVGTRDDLFFVDQTLKQNRGKISSTVIVSPCISLKKDGTLSKESREWLPVVADFCKETNLRFSLQIHKFIWGQKRAV